MAWKKHKGTDLSVFKGREAKLNRAIFQILATKGPQTIYGIHKNAKTYTDLKQAKYTNVLRRVKALQELGFIQKVGLVKTQAGFEAALYEVTERAYLAILLNRVDIEEFIQEADLSSIIAALGALASQYEVFLT